ncbi:MAG: CARDB domain-containing protein [Candidatus Paceibacteria bacterium]
MLKYLIVALLALPAAAALATPNLTSSPRGPYGPYYVGQMPIFYYNLNNTGTTDNGTARPLMNSNWVAVDMFSDNNYPSGKGPHGGWQWVSGDAFGPVPAGGSIIVNNGGAPSSIRWPENDYCMGAVGNHRVMLYVDNGNDVVETNNSDNNSIWSSFTVVNRSTPAPDLTATRTATALGPFVAGQPALLPFVFANIGTAVATESLRARAQIDLFSDGTVNAATTFNGRPALAVGESRTENFTWASAIAGTHLVRVTYVDHWFTVDELNDCNNTSSWVSFQVLPVNIEARHAARTVPAGTTLSTTSISLRNVGSITSPIFPYRILINGVQVGMGSTSAPMAVSATWTNLTVPINWTAPASSATQTLAFTLEVTDPTNGLEATTTTITIPPTSGPIPRLISCPTALSIILGNSSNLTARYWADQPISPTCATAGYTDVTNSATWLSQNMAVASVTNSGTRGQVTGHSIGITPVVASYSSLFATTSVSVIANPITLAIAPTSRFVRSGSAASLRILITANINLNCTVTGGVTAPINFSHTANVGQVIYGPYATRPLAATQKVTVTCVNPLNPAETATQSIDIEVVPVALEV